MRATLLVILLATVTFAGCIGGPDSDDLLLDAGALPADGVNLYLRNLSEPIEGVTVKDGILQQLRIAAPDGIALDTWIVRPDIDGPVPLILEITPYYGGGPPIVQRETGVEEVDASLAYFNRLAEVMVPRGFAVGVSSVRGTGNSDGCFTQGGPGEALDSAAVIEYLAAQPWSNGNVGLIGVSYPGTTPQDVWIEAPPSLKTIVPISGISDMYKYNFVNGVHINIQGFGFNTYYVPYTAVPGTSGPLDPASLPGAVAGEACWDQVEVQTGGVTSTIDGNKDGYWIVRDFHRELLQSWDRNPERASVFYVHGLQDWNVKPHMMEDWLPAIQESGVPYKVWIGQWAHNWPQREDWWNSTLVAWFDQFLKDIDTGILDAPAVQVQDDLGRWRHEAVWPPIEVETVRYWLTAEGAGGSLADVPGSGGAVTFYDYRGGLTNGREDAGPDRIVWRSDPLAEEAVLAGQPVFHATVTADAARTSLILTLAEELPDGAVRPFNFAAQSLNHVRSLEYGHPDITGLAQQVEVRFFPQDDVVQAGSRIVLIASGNIVRDGPGPILQPVTDGAHITIDTEDAWLDLPVDRTLAIEDPQPCWKGAEKDAEKACYLIR